MIRILIVDDQRLIRESLKLMLASEPSVEVVGVADTGESAIAQTIATTPDVVMMDLVMPGMGGLCATQEITQRFPEVKVLILTGSPDSESVESIIAAGASGFVAKDISHQDLVTAIQVVHQGSSYFTSGLIKKLATHLKRSQTLDSRKPLPVLSPVSASALLDELMTVYTRDLAVKLNKIEKNFQLIDQLFNLK